MPTVRLKFVFSVCRLVSRRCHAITALRQFVPGSSQNRTWSVTPSGSQFESSTAGLGYCPIDLGTSILSERPLAFVSPHQDVHASRVKRTSLSSRAESSQSRAVYLSCVVSNRHPFAPPALPGINATMGGSDFRVSPPASSLFTLVRRCPPPADRHADLLGYRVFVMSGSTRPGTPGSTRTTCLGAIRIVACQRVKTVGTLPLKFSGLNTFKVGSTRYLCTSPAFVPTHQPTRYRVCRKARYWARG